MLCPTLGYPTLEGHGPHGVSPQEGQEDDQRSGVPLFYRKAERDVADQPGEEKVLGRSYSTFQHIKGPARNLERHF